MLTASAWSGTNRRRSRCVTEPILTILCHPLPPRNCQTRSIPRATRNRSRCRPRVGRAPSQMPSSHMPPSQMCEHHTLTSSSISANRRPTSQASPRPLTRQASLPRRAPVKAPTSGRSKARPLLRPQSRAGIQSQRPPPPQPRKPQHDTRRKQSPRRRGSRQATEQAAAPLVAVAAGAPQANKERGRAHQSIYRGFTFGARGRRGARALQIGILHEHCSMRWRIQAAQRSAQVF